MSTPTAAQIEALLNFLGEHQELARGSLRSVEARALSHRLWEEVSTILNAMGGCTKSTKQWQKVWTDKKYLAKKAAVAARRSTFATGGGPSTAPQLSQWELKIIYIMGDGFGEPQTTARVPAFVEETQEVASTQSGREIEIDHLLSEQSQETQTTGHASTSQPSTSQQVPVSHATEHRSRYRRRRLSVTRPDSSVRDRLFQIEERRTENEAQTNVELAGIKSALWELCRLVQLLVESKGNN